MNENDDALIERHVELDPTRPYAAEARLVDSGVSVWAIIGHLPSVDGDIDRAAEDYDLESDAVRAALAYYRLHQTQIDARLVANGWELPIPSFAATRPD